MRLVKLFKAEQNNLMIFRRTQATMMMVPVIMMLKSSMSSISAMHNHSTLNNILKPLRT